MNTIKNRDLKRLADRIFEELDMINIEYGGIGLDPKKPFGNSDVEADILQILFYDPEDVDDDGTSCYSNAQRLYARNLYRNEMIPYLKMRWKELIDRAVNQLS